MPKNVVREEHTSSGLGASNQPDGAFRELRALANRSGQDQALLHYGVKRSCCMGPETPKTNETSMAPGKPKKERIPDAGTGYATSGAQYGAETRK